MIKEIFYSQTLDSVVERISKKRAESMFAKGITIHMQASNLTFDNCWQSPASISKADGKFDILVNSYLYYNCDAERGNYIKFYIESL